MTFPKLNHPHVRIIDYKYINTYVFIQNNTSFCLTEYIIISSYFIVEFVSTQ